MSVDVDFSKLHPLSLIADQYNELLNDCCEVKELKSNQIVIRNAVDKSLSHYLLSGCVEVRHSFNERSELQSSETQACYPLEEQIRTGGLIKTKEDSRLLLVDTDRIDKLLSLSQSEEEHADEAEHSEQEGISADYSVEHDWAEIFSHSPLASHLPSSILQELFVKLEDVEVSKGDVIVKRNTPGDYFYIIKKGSARILTDGRGPYSGQEFCLSVGNYFGDEALVADTIRNATVEMLSDGVLGCLGAESFNSIIKQYLVVPLVDDGKLSSKNYQFIDVRLPIEYKHSHYQGSENIPISHLRKKLDHFNDSDTYVITAEGGRRSELAVYLLRQAGFESFYMPNSL